MPGKLSEEDWKNLIRRIKKGQCTPFLGAGACAGRIKAAREIALEWALKHKYPLGDSYDLARVAQFRAVTVDDYTPKDDIAEICKNAELPDYSADNEIHKVLADLPLSVYITTNYDRFMYEALARHPHKNPKREVCPWNPFVEQFCDSIFKKEPNYQPDISNPLVYHLHGYAEVPQSMVLTEDDYLDFLVWFSHEWSNPLRTFPAPLIKALAGTSLLFIGYNRSDWDFRVLFRGLIGSLAATSRMKSIAVQLSPLPDDVSDTDRKQAEEYLEKYFRNIDKIPISVYWGDVKDFAKDLRNHWEDNDDDI